MDLHDFIISYFSKSPQDSNTFIFALIILVVNWLPSIVISAIVTLVATDIYKQPGLLSTIIKLLLWRIFKWLAIMLLFIAALVFLYLYLYPGTFNILTCTQSSVELARLREQLKDAKNEIAKLNYMIESANKQQARCN